METTSRYCRQSLSCIRTASPATDLKDSVAGPQSLPIERPSGLRKGDDKLEFHGALRDVGSRLPHMPFMPLHRESLLSVPVAEFSAASHNLPTGRLQSVLVISFSEAPQKEAQVPGSPPPLGAVQKPAPCTAQSLLLCSVLEASGPLRFHLPWVLPVAVRGP